MPLLLGTRNSHGLGGGMRFIDNHQFGVRLVAGNRDPLDLPLPEQCRGTYSADWQNEGIDNFYANGAGQTFPFRQARIGIRAKAPSPLLEIGTNDNGAGAAGNLPGDIAGVIAKIQNAQVSSPSQSPERSTCPAGCIVETACL